MLAMGAVPFLQAFLGDAADHVRALAEQVRGRAHGCFARAGDACANLSAPPPRDTGAVAPTARPSPVLSCRSSHR